MDEEVLEVSEEVNEWPLSEVYLNPKGGERASQLSCQDYINRAYAYL